jgi:hypothetical protein
MHSDTYCFFFALKKWTRRWNKLKSEKYPWNNISLKRLKFIFSRCLIDDFFKHNWLYMNFYSFKTKQNSPYFSPTIHRWVHKSTRYYPSSQTKKRSTQCFRHHPPDAYCCTFLNYIFDYSSSMNTINNTTTYVFLIV